MTACPSVNVASCCFLDKRVLRNDVFSCPDIWSGCSQLVQTHSHCFLIYVCNNCDVVLPHARCPEGGRGVAPRFVLKRACFGSFFQVLSW